LKNDSEIKIEEIQGDNKANSDDNNLFINLIDGIIFQKWYVKITLIINAEFQITTVALIDSGADMTCIHFLFESISSKNVYYFVFLYT